MKKAARKQGTKTHWLEALTKEERLKLGSVTGDRNPPLPTSRTQLEKELVLFVKGEKGAFAEAKDNWYGNMPPGKNLPFDISDPDHDLLRGIRARIVRLKSALAK